MRSYTADTSLLPGALAPRSSIQSDVRPQGGAQEQCPVPLLALTASTRKQS